MDADGARDTLHEGVHLGGHHLWRLRTEYRALLLATGVELSKSLCEHFTQSRSELFEVVAVTGIRTFDN